MTKIPYDDLIQDCLDDLNRPADRFLHCSSDIVGSLRHAQLRAAGVPLPKRPITDSIRLTTGTLWHEFLHEGLKRQGVPILTEINVDEGLPDGWSGTADWLIWNKGKRRFDLTDLKTTKGEGMSFLGTEPKEEHHAQASAYYYALVNMGYPMSDDIHVLYLPMNQPTWKNSAQVGPVVLSARPLEYNALNIKMRNRARKMEQFLYEFDHTGNLLNPYLAEPMERVQKMNSRFEVSLNPHWLTKYCPYPDNLCNCNTQKTTKIGEWRNGDAGWQYLPRRGYESIKPNLRP